MCAYKFTLAGIINEHWSWILSLMKTYLIGEKVNQKYCIFDRTCYNFWKLIILF